MRGPDRKPFRSTGTKCAICGIEAGNTGDIPVFRYRLARTHYAEGKPTTKAVASIGLCDPCISDKGGPVRDYGGRTGAVRHRHMRVDAVGPEWHMHADFAPRHTHPELGPEGE